MDKEIRYSRLASLPEIGSEGVALLNNATVAVVGCGALGSLCAMYLAASGTGTIHIADFDTVDISNLQRQLFFTENDLGHSKAQTLRDRLEAINSSVRIVTHEKMIRDDDALSLFSRCDVVIDGSDNPSTKLMTDRIAYRTGTPCVIAGVRGFAGQVMTCLDSSVRYGDVFGTEAPCNGFTPCSIAGVLGPAAGVAASIQAAETIKLISGAGATLINRLLDFDLLDMKFNVYQMKS